MKHEWRSSQNAMKTYAARTSADDPDARPSSPSVRFTEFDAAARITNTHA